MKREKRKEKREKLGFNNMPKLLLLLFFLTTISLSAQTVENINLPGDAGGGTMTGDIIYANNRIFTYSSDEISVYDANNSFIGNIPLNNWGKFNPFYFNPTMWPGEFNAMEYNQQYDMLYAMTPDLHIKVIDVSNIDQTWDISPLVQLQGEQTLQGLLQTLNGRIVMKYDSNHGRLYILVSSRDPALNCPGNFHIRRNYFGIYDIDNQKEPGDEGYMTLRHGEIYDFDLPQYELDDQMNNFEFNTDQGQDYFYLTRLNRFEIWKIPDSDPVELLHTEYVDANYFNGFYKFGKMLYINNGSLHKIVIVPYMIPFESVNNNVGAVYVIDGDHTDIIVDENIKEFYAPSKRIVDVTYLKSSNDLIMSYSPDEYIQYYDEVNHPEYDPVDPTSDIAVYQYNNASDVFSFAGSYITNQPENTSVYDMNSSIQMLVVTPPDPNDNPNTVLIGKKDQIVKLVYDVGTEVYAHGQLLEAENNMFKNGTCGNGNSYIINSTMGKLEVFDNIDFVPSEIKTGHPVYHIAANQSGNNMYIYNKLNVDNTGIYSYLVGDGDPTVTFLNVDKPVGTCIHNPYQDDFLVSKIESNQATIEIFNASDNTNNTEISIAGAQFAKEMFISKDGKLYIMTNMQYPETPQVYIYDALNYQYVDGPFVISDLSCNDDFISYVAHFDQGPSDVYMSIFPQELKSAPYNTEANRMYDPTPAGEGKLIRLGDEIADLAPIDLPGKVICPGREGIGGSSQYDGKVFVIGKDLTVFNTVTMETTFVGGHDFIDIIYSAQHDKLFAFTNTVIGNCGENRTCKIWAIDIDDNDAVDVSEYNIPPIPGQAAAFFSNPYDGRVYLHQKVDNEKLGEVQVSLHSFDPSEASPTWTTTTLGITSFSPEYDQTNDPLRTFYYNMTTPYINPYTNHIYLPNGGHSCVSKVSFEAEEPLLLNNGDWAWLSFPRMNRGGNDPVVVDAVLSGNIDPDGYEYGSELKNLPPESYEVNKNVFDGAQWLPTGYLYNIQSTLGYKLYLDYDDPQPENKWVHLFGNVLDPAEPVNIYENYDNWVGYWLYESQSPFSAIPDNVLDELISIKGQGWYCSKQLNYHEGNPVPYWVCAVHEGDMTLDYGDMVILKTESNQNFQWQCSGNPPSSVDRQETEHYQFSEQADYTSFMIDLDTSANPQEIGAFIGDSCVGASTVLAGDTIVLIPGYTEGMSGDVTFEEFYGSQKSHRPAINEYYVNNNKTGAWQKRTIHTSERQDHYFISFKHVDVPAGTDADQWFAIFPNPVDNMLNINYSIAETAKVNISVFDSYGRQVATLLDAGKPVGSHTMQWDLAGNNGTKLPKGLYIIKIKVDDNAMSRKVVVD